MKKKTWQYTTFKFFSQVVDFLNAWDPFIGGPNLKIAANDSYIAVFYKYHRGLAYNERPTEQEMKEALYT